MASAPEQPRIPEAGDDAARPGERSAGESSPRSRSAGASGALRRLKQRRDFLRVAGAGRRAAREGLVLQAAPTPEPERGAPRIGFTASRKVGNAVARNRARRRLRAVADIVIRSQAAPGHDYVLIGRQATLQRDFAALCEDCRSALRRLKLSRGEGRPDARPRDGRGDAAAPETRTGTGP